MHLPFLQILLDKGVSKGAFPCLQLLQTGESEPICLALLSRGRRGAVACDRRFMRHFATKWAHQGELLEERHTASHHLSLLSLQMWSFYYVSMPGCIGNTIQTWMALWSHFVLTSIYVILAMCKDMYITTKHWNIMLISKGSQQTLNNAPVVCILQSGHNDP